MIYILNQNKDAIVMCKNRIVISATNDKEIISYDGFDEYGEYYDILGIYKTSERAREVLDGIWQIIDYDRMNGHTLTMYEMSKE